MASAGIWLLGALTAHVTEPLYRIDYVLTRGRLAPVAAKHHWSPRRSATHTLTLMLACTQPPTHVSRMRACTNTRALEHGHTYARARARTNRCVREGS
jgi:hypothetical protein